MSRRRSSWNEDRLVPILRHGHIEEVYCTYGYSPVLDERGDVGGVLAVCTETTSRVIADRRSRTMRSLAERTALTTDPAVMLNAAVEALRDARHDVPFALVYRYDGRAHALRLVRSRGARRPLAGRHDRARQAGPLAVRGSRAAKQVVACDPTLGLPGGVWPEPAPAFFVVPCAPSGRNRSSDVIVFGLSPRLPFDDGYRNHLNQIANHLGLAQPRSTRSDPGGGRRRAKQHPAAGPRRDRARDRSRAHLPARQPALLSDGEAERPRRQELPAGVPRAQGDAIPGVVDHVYDTGELFSTEE